MNEPLRFSLAALVWSLLPGCVMDTGDCDAPSHRGINHVEAPSSEVAAALDDGELSSSDCEALCQDRSGVYSVSAVHGCSVPAFHEPTPGAAGAAGGGGELPVSDPLVVVKCDETYRSMCEGRRHATWTHGARGTGASALGRWFAEASSAEQGSVHSFLALQKELHGFAAPAKLVTRAMQAAADEVRHARAMRRLAERHGGTPVNIPMREQTRARTLLEFAIENATEGCVFESYAAMVASHQAACSTDPVVRAALAEIARDEIQHGQLAWDIHVWCLSRLTADEVRRVDRAMRRALRRLAAECVTQSVAFEGAEKLGLPAPAVALKLANALRAEALHFATMVSQTRPPTIICSASNLAPGANERHLSSGNSQESSSPLARSRRTSS